MYTENLSSTDLIDIDRYIKDYNFVVYSFPTLKIATNICLAINKFAEMGITSRTITEEDERK